MKFNFIILIFFIFSLNIYVKGDNPQENNSQVNNPKENNSKELMFNTIESYGLIIEKKSLDRKIKITKPSRFLYL